MISRYEVKEISKIWAEESRFKYLLQVEIALLKVLENRKMIPAGTTNKYADVKINVERINEIELVTRHDVIAFCSSITEQVPTEAAKYFHFGVTSSDILDTALSLQIKESLQILVSELKDLIEALDKKIDETKDLLTIGRSHGMYAEPMMFAQKFFSYQAELKRRLRYYEHCLQTEITGAISGTVGNYTILTPELELEVLNELGLKRETVSTQVIPRDHIALITHIGSLTAVALERMSLEFRLLHHSDINELHEGFKKGQKGSSAMPHKKNPISSENITGLSRLIRSHSEIAVQNNLLWHERDISHSSNERMFLPDHFGILTYIVRRMKGTVTDLELHREQIEAKALNNFTALSSFVLHEMILNNNCTREDLYAIIQKASFESKSFEQFYDLIEAGANERSFVPPKRITIQELKNRYQTRFEEARRLE